jgi:hypothetical protein
LQFWLAEGALIPIGIHAGIPPWWSTGDGERRDAAENIKLEVGHGSHMTERYGHFTPEQWKAAAEKLPV